jgi:hypothetical protein
MRRRRTIYFNDARHYYLFVFEPPMKLEDAWRPVDEAAGTAVDTFIYGVAREDHGLFYPSKVGMRFGQSELAGGLSSISMWRAWHNMQSLIDRGLDPLTVLIDRAHDKGMDFFASLRLGGYGGMDPALCTKNGGRGFVHEEMRDHQLAVLRELATNYPTDGVELDLAAPPFGGSSLLQDEDVPGYTPVMTEWVGRVSEMVHGRLGGRGQVGARVYPTEEMNLARGLDVRTMIREGLLDYVTPMIYGYDLVDSNMPFDWLVEAAHDADTSVYPMVQPYYFLENERRFHTHEHASPAMMRAAVASFWDRGADGMYTWFLKWPLGDSERRTLTEMGDPDMVKEGDKHYFMNRRTEPADMLGYVTLLPIEIEASDTDTRHKVPFYIADDIEGASDRIRQVLLRIRVYNLVSSDRLTLRLNGESLSGETCLRSRGELIAPYLAMWLEFHLKKVRPRKGHNMLEIVLDERAEGLTSPLRVEDVEILVEYGSYPSKL